MRIVYEYSHLGKPAVRFSASSWLMWMSLVVSLPSSGAVARGRDIGPEPTAVN